MASETHEIPTDIEYARVTLKCNINSVVCNTLVDSGASCSVIDKNKLDNLGSFPISKTINPLVDASGNNMDVVGSVLLPVHPIGLRKPKLVEFCVTNSKDILVFF